MYAYLNAPVCQNRDCFLSAFSFHEKMQMVGTLLHIIIRKKKTWRKLLLAFSIKHALFHTLNYESINDFQENNPNIEISPGFVFSENVSQLLSSFGDLFLFNLCLPPYTYAFGWVNSLTLCFLWGDGDNWLRHWASRWTSYAWSLCMPHLYNVFQL